MISVCILTKNCSSTLAKTLESTLSFPEVVVLDNGSVDETLSIAASYPNVKIFHSPFLGFGTLRNLAAQKANYDWILALDSDEILSAALISEIQALSLTPSSVYSIIRHNFLNQKQIKGCGWHPERVFRLYHKQFFSYSLSKVHESLITQGSQPVFLKHPILHTPYRGISDFLSKMQHYSTLFAEEHCKKKPASFWKALSHGCFAFFRSYFLQRGFMDGKEGFFISLYNGNTSFYKYMKLNELNKQ